MKPEAMLQELERAAEELDVKVTYESLSATIGHGGLCRVKGQYRVIIEKRATAQERAATLAQALIRFDTAQLALSKKTRQLVDYYRQMRAQRQRQQQAS